MICLFLCIKLLEFFLHCDIFIIYAQTFPSQILITVKVHFILNICRNEKSLKECIKFSILLYTITVCINTLQLK